MLRKNFLFRTAILAVFLGLTAMPASAEWLLQRVARGNNVGLGLMCDWACPLITASWTGNTIQYPKGSGNLIMNDCWTIGMMTANDIDGNGSAEDTAVLGSGGRDSMPSRCSIEAASVLEALSQSGENMETASSARSGTGINRVWTSLDAGELAEWPVEARMGHTESGEPIIHGAETMFEHTGDVFNSWGAPLSGYYQGWSFYFLDFAESNSMVYVHNYIQNVTEYMKWNPSYGSNMWVAGGAAPNSGWTWKGMVLFNNWRQMAYGSVQLGWCYHPEKDIIGLWSPQPQISAWTPQEPPLMALHVLKYPELNGQTIGLQNIHTVAGGEFGVSSPGNLLASGLSYARVYQAVMNTAGLYPGVTNPFTGKPMTDGYPGVLTSDDARYGQWIWGGGSNWNHYTFWGEMHDVAPRDTMNLDWVIMFTPTGVTPLVHPTYDLANIDDPMMQEGFAPLEHYTNVAETVYNGGFVVPSTPAAPALTIVPGDRSVTITWSDINLKTPDTYALFLEQNPDLDPNGIYRKYDFEGYRLYRSFVGPNDSHSEEIADYNISDGTLQFHFIDKYEDDQPYFRMRNGLKVWYALVPYDLNYDPATGEAFSLPDPTSGKVWNRAGESGLYNVIPRSEASNFKPGSLSSVEFVPGANASLYLPTNSTTLAGDGSGKITEPVKILTPTADFELDAVIAEKLTQQETAYLAVTGIEATSGACGNRLVAQMYYTLTSSGGQVYDDVGAPVSWRYGGDVKERVYSKLSDDGADYAILATFTGLQTGSIYYSIDMGSYSGATIDGYEYRCGVKQIGESEPSNPGYNRAGNFQVTWKSSGDGMLTLQVKDQTRGVDVPFSQWMQPGIWGFITPLDEDRKIHDEDRDHVPYADRVHLMVQTIPADQADDFAFYLNGFAWKVSGITSMPTDGAVMNITNAWGTWNSDKTSFTQYAEPAFPGDKYQITIDPTTMNDSDIDLSKVKVVPNPYIASSFLDLSVTQRRIEFINLPARCTIRIYSLGGNLINVINHIGSNRSGWGDYTDWDRLTQGVPKEFEGYDNHSGTEPWNLRNRFGQTIASGLYFFHVTDERGETVTGKFYVVN